MSIESLLRLPYLYQTLSSIQTPDFSKIIEGIKAILKLIFGEQIPTWILTVAGYVLLIALILVALVGLLSALVKIKDLLANNIWPLFYDKEKARRANRRKKFADHIESELRRLNNLEAWSDYRFTELEAEVDAEGRRRIFGILPSIYRIGSTLRRERSLSKALKSSDERLIIVEGEPGSGKSVALRHVAILLARQAMRSRSTTSAIPIYVNLKEIERKKGEVVDRNLVESFVLRVLNRVNDRDIEEFLEEEFNVGMQNGTWFFLFDSFDEIPEVLSSTEADKSIQEYATAISDFLHGLNACRGVIASRFFHGPKQFGWPRFRILPLTSERKSELIKKADLKAGAEAELIGQLETSRQEINSMASNPMFLGLLCEHLRAGYPFPENSYTVLETYIDSRLTRDKDRLFRRYRLDSQELRAAAEAAAFCMAADPGLGLSPKREDIKTAAQKLNIKLGKQFDKTLDALTYLKLARADTSTTTDKSEQFTFSHRRFQEYFSTAVVLRDPGRVSPTHLLLDARWRETAVVIFQTQTPETLTSFIKEAELLIQGFVNTLKNYKKESTGLAIENDGHQENTTPDRFPWPPHALHIMGLLQDGFTRRLTVLPDSLRKDVGDVLTIATNVGISADAKWALDVAGSAPASVLTDLLRQAFSNRSQVLRDSAYRQVAKLNDIPSDLTHSIRATLIRMTLTGRLRRERSAIHAHLSRLNDSSNLLRALRLLLWLPAIDLGLNALVLSILVLNFFVNLWFQGSHSQARILGFCLNFVLVVLAYSSLYWNASLVDEASTLGFRYIRERIEHERTVDSYIFGLILNNRMLFVILCIYLPFILVGLSRQLVSSSFERRTVFWGGSPRLMWIFLYAGIWAPSALMFCVQGRFLSPVYLAIYPILFVITLARRGISVLIPQNLNWKDLVTEVLSDWKDLLVSVAIFIGLLSAFGLLIFLLIYGASRIPHSGKVIAICICLALLKSAALWVYRWIHDALNWHRWRSSKRERVPAAQFVEQVRSYKSDRYRLQFINAVRTKGLINNSPTAEEVVYNFARELEAAPVVSATSSRSSMLNLVQVLRGKTTFDGDHTYSVAVLDEVLRLLEQMRSTC
jgi:hypothetical protein